AIITLIGCTPVALGASARTGTASTPKAASAGTKPPAKTRSAKTTSAPRWAETTLPTPSTLIAGPATPRVGGISVCVLLIVGCTPRTVVTAGTAVPIGEAREASWSSPLGNARTSPLVRRGSRRGWAGSAQKQRYPTAQPPAHHSLHQHPPQIATSHRSRGI